MTITLFLRRAAWAGFLIAALFAAGIASAQTAPADIPAALTGVAQELGCTSKAACETVCNANLSKCIDVSERLDVYSNDVKKLATSFKQEVLNKLKDATEENFEERIVALARDLVRNKPSLAKQFDVNTTKVAAADAIVKEVKNAGVDVAVCSRPAESLTREELVSCLNASKRLAEKSETVKPYITEDRLKQAQTSDALLNAQKNGLLNGCGDGNLDSCGQFCFDPAKTSQGEGAIPEVCLNLARTVFKDEGGEEALRSAYRGIKENYDMQLRVADRIILTTPDGRALRGRTEIKGTCDNAFETGDIELAKTCGEFAVNNGFVKREEMEEGLKFLRSVSAKGPINFKDCRQNPQACEQFIPPEARGEFQAMRQIEDVMRAEIGFDPQQCATAGFDPAIGERCLQGSKRALLKLEGTVTGSEAQRVFADIRRHIEEGERFAEKRPEFEQNFTGPGGCNGPEACFKYCSDPAHGPECLSFGAQSGLIEKGEVRGRFEEYQGHLQTGAFQGGFPGVFPGAPYGPGGAASGTPYGGPYGAPYGGQTPPQGGGIGGPIGPSPECFRAIESGEFERARQLCQSGFSGGFSGSGGGQYPGAPYPGPGGYPGTGGYPGQYPSSGTSPGDYRGFCAASFPPPCPPGQEHRIFYENGCPVYRECTVVGASETGISPGGQQICPSLPTVNSCPSGQRKEISYSSPECGTYYRCVPEGQEGTIPPPPPPGTDPFAECGRSGGVWMGSYCRYPTPTPSDTSTYATDPAEGCRRVGGAWDPGRQYCQMPGTGSCPSGQYWYVPSGGAAGYCRSSSDTGSGSTSSYNYVPPAGQREQIWNSLGLRSWIRSDASESRINALKSSCANVPGGSNIWTSSAGDPSSEDFGMPDPSKCQQAGSCASSQYFDGTSCTSSGGTSCPSGQYWNGSSCSTTSTSTGSTGGGGYAGDASSCPGFAYSRWDSQGRRYCQLNNEQRCDYDYPSYLTNGGNYTSGECPADGGSSGGTGGGSSSGQRQQTWNSLGLQSSVRSDASQSRIDSLKASCANVPNGANVWMPNAGDYASQDFGMPDPNKCAQAGSCASGQYFNGTSCTSSGGTSCPSGQYWSGTACVSSGSGTSSSTGSTGSTGSTSCSSELIAILGDGCHNMGNAYFDGPMNRYAYPGSTTVKNCSSEYLSGCSSGSSSATSCSSGQYWNGTSCVSSSSGTSCPSGQYWNGSACADSSTTSGSTTSCGSGQYWNGTSCVTNPPSCSSGQYWDGSACVTSSSGGSTGGSTTSCPSDQYWNGSACVTSSSGGSTGGGGGATTDPAAACAQAGGTWNGATCQMPSTGGTSAAPSVMMQMLAALSKLLETLLASLR